MAEMSYASKGVAGSGLGLGIAGTALGLLSGGLGNIFGGGNYSCHENMPVNRYELGLQQENAGLKSQIALRDANTYSDQKLLEVYKYFDGELKDIRATMCASDKAQAVINAKFESGFAILNTQVASINNTIANLTTISIERVKTILAINRAGEKAETLIGSDTEEVIKEPTYRSEEDSITRFDGKSKRNKKNKRNKGERDAKAEAKESSPEIENQPQEEAPKEASTQEGMEHTEKRRDPRRNRHRKPEHRGDREHREPKSAPEEHNGEQSNVNAAERSEEQPRERNERGGRNDRRGRHNHRRGPRRENQQHGGNEE
jgi:hypothetical protein